MRHVRCLAHAFVTALALVSWGSVGWIIYDNPGTGSSLRLAGMALMSLAAVTTGLALLPVVLHAYVRQRRSLLDAEQAAIAGWHLGFAAGQASRNDSPTGEPDRSLRIVVGG